MTGFLVEYNRLSRNWRLTSFEGPNGPREALMQRLELEKERVDTDWEIAALASDSERSIRETHSRYFSGQELPSV